MIYAIRKDGETSEKLVLRYKKMFFQSRIANKLKSERYNERKTSNNAILNWLYFSSLRKKALTSL